VLLSAYGRPTQPVARGQHVARPYTGSDKKKSCNRFPGKAEIKRRSSFENSRAVCLWRCA